MGEGLCCEAAAFYAAETLHGVVPVTHQIFQILADVAVAGLVFFFVKAPKRDDRAKNAHGLEALEAMGEEE